MNNPAEWRNQYAEWIDNFPWQWFCTLTFREEVTIPQARWRLHKWIEEVQAELGTKNFQWIAIPEYGRTGADLHYHALVGGLKEWDMTTQLKWMKRWFQLAGDARIAYFNPSAGGPKYILKRMRPENSGDIELHLLSPSAVKSRVRT